MSPADLWSLRMDTRQVSRLTDINTDMRRETIMSTPVSFNFEGAGDSVQAWLFKPVNFEAGKKYPLAVLIHGGYVFSPPPNELHKPRIMVPNDCVCRACGACRVCVVCVIQSAGRLGGRLVVPLESPKLGRTRYAQCSLRSVGRSVLVDGHVFVVSEPKATAWSRSTRMARPAGARTSPTPCPVVRHKTTPDTHTLVPLAHDLESRSLLPQLGQIGAVVRLKTS
jgi:hypothetical protein